MFKRAFFVLIFIPIRLFCAPAISLDDAIVKTLENQKEIQISIYNLEKQKGVLQQSAGPFDPLLTSTLLDVFSNNIEEESRNTLSVKRYRNPNSFNQANTCRHFSFLFSALMSFIILNIRIS